jgi:hypothetical protein
MEGPTERHPSCPGPQRRKGAEKGSTIHLKIWTLTEFPADVLLGVVFFGVFE